MPSIDAVPALLLHLAPLPLGASGAPASVAAGLRVEHVGVPGVELVVDAAGDVGQRELALLGGQHRVEHHLEQQVAELLLQVVEARAGSSSTWSSASSTS